MSKLFLAHLMDGFSVVCTDVDFSSRFLAFCKLVFENGVDREDDLTESCWWTLDHGRVPCTTGS